MRITWQGICLWAVVLLAFANAAHAQTVTPEDEYKKLIRVNEEIQPLGATPFGEARHSAAALAVLVAVGAVCDTAASGAPAMMPATMVETNFAARLPILVSRLRMTQL